MQQKESLPIGTILDSGVRNYEIKSVLGKGGFGITYLATSTIYVDNIPVVAQFAIKEHYISSMNERQGASVSISNVNNTEEIKESIDSFLVEAKRLNKLSLNHNGLVRVNESFRANGTAYYVMEYIKGQSLRDYVKHSPQGKLGEAEALLLFRPIAETIGYLHDNMVTHLDIKPDNILIRENGEPVVIDFGLSKHYSAKGTPTSTIKATGCSAGYSPIEQYVGINTFTPEADVYALGATLLYMLTGKDPVLSSEMSAGIIQRSLPEDVSEETMKVITQTMEKLKEVRIKRVVDIISNLYNNKSDDIPFPKVKKLTESGANQTKVIKSRKAVVTKNPVPMVKDYGSQPSSNKIIFLFLGIAVALVIGGSIFLFKPRRNSSLANTELQTTEDSLAYAIGMSQVPGLMNYLDSTLHVDTTMKVEFKDGLYYGSGLKKDANPSYEGKQQDAFHAGIQIGSQIANQMIRGINHEIYGSDSTKTISLPLFMAGFTDGIARNYRHFSQAEASELVTTLITSVKSTTLEKQYADNKRAGKEFLEKNKKKSDVHVLPSSVQYKILKEGTGPKPTEESTVIVHYEGKLLNGIIFDSSYKRGKTVAFKCNQVIKGLSDALVNMPVGSKWEVYIPQELAYGYRQQDQIPPFSMLIFTLELFSID